MPVIEWTDYLKYRAALRRFDLAKLEHIIRHSSERYFDTETGRSIVVTPRAQIGYDPDVTKGDAIVPVTVHTTTRHQIAFSLRTARFIHE